MRDDRLSQGNPLRSGLWHRDHPDGVAGGAQKLDMVTIDDPVFSSGGHAHVDRAPVQQTQEDMGLGGRR
jgi:hypothetical protein